MIDTVSAFLEAAKPFITLFDTWAERYEPQAVADHICYKCSNTQEFEQLRALLETSAGFLYQSIISQRRIAIIELPEPLTTVLGDIWYLELSDQKPDQSQTSGFDHIEIFPVQGTVGELAMCLERQGMHLERIVRPHHTTIDGWIEKPFKIRLEDERLVEKIKREEMM